jgi:hypothetical protein
MAVVTSNLGHTVQPLAPAKLAVLETSGTANDNAVDFGVVSTAAQSIDVTLRNDGQKSLTIAALGIVGADAGDFSFEVPGAQSGTTGLTRLPGQTATVRVHFTPGASGARSATLRFWHNDGTVPSPFNVALSAQVAAAPVVQFVTADEELVSVRPTTPTKPTTLTAGEELAVVRSETGGAGSTQITSTTASTTTVATPMSAVTPTRPAPAKPNAHKMRPVSAAHPARPVAPGAKPANILTARLVARSSTAIPPSRLFATGNPRRHTPGVSELLRSPSQEVAPKPAPSQPAPVGTFNAANRIRLTSAPRSH